MKTEPNTLPSWQLQRTESRGGLVVKIGLEK